MNFFVLADHAGSLIGNPEHFAAMCEEEGLFRLVVSARHDHFYWAGFAMPRLGGTTPRRLLEAHHEALDKTRRRRFGDGPVHETSDEGWDVTLAHNLKVMFHMCRAVTGRMLQQDVGENGVRGAIVNIGSALAEAPEIVSLLDDVLRRVKRLAPEAPEPKGRKPGGRRKRLTREGGGA